MVMKMKKLLISLLSLLLITGCAQPEEEEVELKKYSQMDIDSGFDTYLSIQTTAASQEEFSEYFKASCDRFKELNALFDIYNNYEGINNLKTINDNAGIAPVEVSDEIMEMLKLAKEFYELSDGKFDITMGSVMKIWHEYRSEGIELNENEQLGTIPTLEELTSAKAYTGWKHIHLDEENNTVYIDDPNVSLDVGGIAKGFAAEDIANMLEEKGILMGIVDAGGNNRMIKEKLDGTPWNVGIQDPGNSGIPNLAGGLFVISRKGQSSFVTSGDYQRYYVAEDEQKYHHIIDPVTLFPATYFHSVSIVMNNSAVSDAMSTTLFTMSYEEGLAFVEKYNSTHEDKASVVWIMDEPVDTQYGRKTGNYFVAYTEDLEGYIRWND